MKTKKPSAFQVFKQKRHGNKDVRVLKMKKRKHSQASSHESSVEPGLEPQPSTSQPHVQSDIVMPALERNIRHIACGNLEADECFKWLIQPVTPSEFHLETWEKKPLHIRNRNPEYYARVFSCKEFDDILRNHNIEYKTNIDVVSYKDGHRETHNPDGRAYPAIVWDYFETGDSIRFLNPQTYSKSVWKLCSLLQEYFGSFVGCNMYLTPPGSQGFAPHYDDIEAFILQIEGVKQWKVYQPRTKEEYLPRESSRNFSQDEIGDPILEIELHPGDLLYFPRGYIHQAKTTDSVHSLHLTLSTLQKTTWGDLLLKALPKALENAMENDIAYRESLPRNYMGYMGYSRIDKSCQEKELFLRKMFGLTRRLVNYLQLDTAADSMTKEFIHSSLPPFFTREEKMNSIHGSGAKWLNGRISGAVEIKPYSEIRLIRKRAVCLVREDERLLLYHTVENSRVYQEKEPLYVEIDTSYYRGVEFLIDNFPLYVTVEQLPLGNLEEQIDLATLLYDKGLLRTRVPMSEDSDGS